MKRGEWRVKSGIVCFANVNWAPLETRAFERDADFIVKLHKFDAGILAAFKGNLGNLTVKGARDQAARSF